MVNWVAFLLSTRKVQVSNLYLEERYTDYRLQSYSSDLAGSFRNSIIKLGEDYFLPRHFQCIIH